MDEILRCFRRQVRAIEIFLFPSSTSSASHSSIIVSHNPVSYNADGDGDEMSFPNTVTVEAVDSQIVLLFSRIGIYPSYSFLILQSSGSSATATAKLSHSAIISNTTFSLLQSHPLYFVLFFPLSLSCHLLPLLPLKLHITHTSYNVLFYIGGVS